MKNTWFYHRWQLYRAALRRPYNKVTSFTPWSHFFQTVNTISHKNTKQEQIISKNHPFVQLHISKTRSIIEMISWQTFVPPGETLSLSLSRERESSKFEFVCPGPIKVWQAEKGAIVLIVHLLPVVFWLPFGFTGAEIGSLPLTHLQPLPNWESEVISWSASLGWD